MMKHLPTLIATLVCAAACDQKDGQAAPTAPAPSLARTPNRAMQIGKQQAAVCRAYQKQLAALKADRARRPADDTLRAHEQALIAIVDDACR